LLARRTLTIVTTVYAIGPASTTGPRGRRAAECSYRQRPALARAREESKVRATELPAVTTESPVTTAWTKVGRRSGQLDLDVIADDA